MATASVNCFLLPFKTRNLSLTGSSSCSASRSYSTGFNSLSFSSTLSVAVKHPFVKVKFNGYEPRGLFCGFDQKLMAQFAYYPEKNKAYKKKVLEALNDLKKKSDARAEEVLPVEKLIAEAFSAIDKAVKIGTLHRNTGARRTSRLARRKKDVEIHHGCIPLLHRLLPDLNLFFFFFI